MMGLPNQALVLVADGRKMLFFRNHGDENQIDLRTEAHDERQDAKDSDLKTDRGGAGRRKLCPSRTATEEKDYQPQKE
ncbi:MAG: host attachment protein, partial [Sphingomicrobium sp.]